MKNKTLWIGIFVSIILLVIIINFYYSIEKEEISEKIYYDWNVHISFFNESYQNETGYFNKAQTDIFKDSILKKFNEEDYQFNGYVVLINHTMYITKEPREGYLYGISLNLTYEAKEKLDELDLSEYPLGTYQPRNPIIEQSIQKIPENEDETITCESDRECIKLGGSGCVWEAITINRAYYNYWNDKLTEANKDMLCTAVFSNHWTRFADPKCIDNICELIPNKELTCPLLFLICSNNPQIELENEIPCKKVINICEEENITRSINYQKCINETKVPGEYVQGEILIDFYLTITDQEKIDFIQLLDLVPGIILRDIDRIKVPEGTEVEWICKLKEIEVVKEAYFNRIAHVT